jgi:hypothetical protein
MNWIKYNWAVEKSNTSINYDHTPALHSFKLNKTILLE